MYCTNVWTYRKYLPDEHQDASEVFGLFLYISEVYYEICEPAGRTQIVKDMTNWVPERNSMSFNILIYARRWGEKLKTRLQTFSLLLKFHFKAKEDLHIFS